MIEANAQLNLIQLPKEVFGEYENLIKSTKYQQFKTILGEDPILHYKKYLISQQNQASRAIQLQPKDGSVVSFEKY